MKRADRGGVLGGGVRMPGNEARLIPKAPARRAAAVVSAATGDAPSALMSIIAQVEGLDGVTLHAHKET